MFHPIYQIELRQIEVQGLNARHYFWVLKKHLPGGGTRVLGELHGGPADPKTGKMKSFSLGGDPLKFFEFKGRRFYNQSLKLPFAIADIDIKENILRRWGQGIRAGGLVNKAGKQYSLLKTNSNAVAEKLGEWMGFKVQRIVDPRVDAPQPFVPGLTTDLFAGSAGRGVRLSPYLDDRKPVGFLGIIRDSFGNEPDPNPFRDDFRDNLPF